MTTTIEFYFDFGSPTAYLAHKELKKLAERDDVEVVYEPILLGAVHKATNNTPPGLIPSKGRYMLMHDLPRFVKRYQVPFKMNSNFPIKTLTMMRACYAAKELGVFEQYVDLVYDAMWAQNLNLGQEEVFREFLESNGLDAQKILDLCAQDSIKDQLKENTDKSVKRGCFGAPTMFIGEEMYFGQDRLDFIKEALN